MDIDLFAPIDPFNGEVTFEHSFRGDIYQVWIFHKPTRRGWQGSRTTTEFNENKWVKGWDGYWRLCKVFNYEKFEPNRMAFIERGLKELGVI